MNKNNTIMTLAVSLVMMLISLNVNAMTYNEGIAADTVSTAADGFDYEGDSLFSVADTVVNERQSLPTPLPWLLILTVGLQTIWTTPSVTILTKTKKTLHTTSAQLNG